MIANETITAVIMTQSSRVNPTAVRTESTENTISSNTIWIITDLNLADVVLSDGSCSSSNSTVVMNFCYRLV